MIKLPYNIIISDSELECTFIRASGPGGQNVNKVATAVQLRFNVLTSGAFSEEIRARLLIKLEKKLTQEGELIIKAHRWRTQLANRQDALDRLQAILATALYVPKKRKKTKPTFSSVQRRLSGKKLQSKKKSSRQKSRFDF